MLLHHDHGISVQQPDHKARACRRRWEGCAIQLFSSDSLYKILKLTMLLAINFVSKRTSAKSNFSGFGQIFCYWPSVFRDTPHHLLPGRTF